MEVTTKSAKETKEFGRKISSDLRGGEVIALSGELGSGKTTFVQGLAEGLGISGRIISPTFIILRKYLTQKPSFSGVSLFHVDLYRLESNIENEMRNLGVLNEWGKKENIFVIEWAEKASGIIPPTAIWFNFKYTNEGRIINSN